MYLSVSILSILFINLFVWYIKYKPKRHAPIVANIVTRILVLNNKTKATEKPIEMEIIIIIDNTIWNFDLNTNEIIIIEANIVIKLIHINITLEVPIVLERNNKIKLINKVNKITIM